VRVWFEIRSWTKAEGRGIDLHGRQHWHVMSLSLRSHRILDSEEHHPPILPSDSFSTVQSRSKFFTRTFDAAAAVVQSIRVLRAVRLIILIG